MTGLSWQTAATPLVWTVITVACSVVLGHVCGAVLIARIPRIAPSRQRHLVETAAASVRKRLPWWCALIGCWVAAAYWPLTPEARALVDRTLFTLGAVSVPFTAAAVASQAIETYGRAIAPALPIVMAGKAESAPVGIER